MYVPITEAGDQLEELVDLADAGEEIFLTRDGEPVVRLRPLQPIAGAGEIAKEG